MDSDSDNSLNGDIDAINTRYQEVVSKIAERNKAQQNAPREEQSEQRFESVFQKRFWKKCFKDFYEEPTTSQQHEPAQNELNESSSLNSEIIEIRNVQTWSLPPYEPTGTLGFGQLVDNAFKAIDEEQSVEATTPNKYNQRPLDQDEEQAPSTSQNQNEEQAPFVPVEPSTSQNQDEESLNPDPLDPEYEPENDEQSSVYDQDIEEAEEELQKDKLRSKSEAHFPRPRKTQP